MEYIYEYKGNTFTATFNCYLTGITYKGEYSPFDSRLTITSTDNFHAEITGIDERQARRIFTSILDNLDCYIK